MNPWDFCWKGILLFEDRLNSAFHTVKLPELCFTRMFSVEHKRRRDTMMFDISIAVVFGRTELYLENEKYCVSPSHQPNLRYPDESWRDFFPKNFEGITGISVPREIDTILGISADVPIERVSPTVNLQK